MGLKFLGKSSFVDLALVVGSTKFQGDGEEMELGPNKCPSSHALQAFQSQAQSGVNHHVQPRPDQQTLGKRNSGWQSLVSVPWSHELVCRFLVRDSMSRSTVFLHGINQRRFLDVRYKGRVI